MAIDELRLGYLGRTMIVYLMGVSGSGKSTIGTALAARLGWPFADGDDFHSAANKAKMAANVPLNDDDRKPWLFAINEYARLQQAKGESVVIACSALKVLYREWLREGLNDVEFVMLDGSKELIAERLAHRPGHFMNPKQLDNQLATLETPREAICVVNDGTVEEVVGRIVMDLGKA